jgi:CRP-like cAMP-binding protein
MVGSSSSSNHLLDLLLKTDSTLRGLPERVSLRARDTVALRGDVPREVYFPVDCVLSFVIVTNDGQSTEVAPIGSEGMTGFGIALGADSVLTDIVTQVPGEAYRLKTEEFKVMLAANSEARRIVGLYILALFSQVMQSVACNRLHAIEARLARWLLMTADRVGSAEFLITHEFLAALLGVTRTSVTLSCRTLQRAGLVEYRRGRMRILDRDALEDVSCECYTVIRDAYHDFLPTLQGRSAL